MLSSDSVRTFENTAAPPVIQFWHEEQPPSYLDEALASFDRHNPDSEHLIFNERTAEAFIEEHFSPREVAAFRSCAVPAMQSDYFRYCAVFVLGGVYADVDYHCVGSLSRLLDFEGHVFRRPLGMAMNGFFLFRSPRHPFLRLVIDVVTANIESREQEDIAGVTGPTIFSGLAMLYQLGSIEAFLEVSKNSTSRWQPKLMGEVAGTYDRVTEAFEGVRFDPMERLRGYVSNRDVAHAKQGKHWTRWESSIYR